MTTSKQSTKQSYSQIILNHMLAGKRLSNMQAYDQYGMTCFLQRISDLRAAGIVIKDEMIEKNGKRYKSYWIDQPANTADSEVN
ncbi:helix-turn-helix domain-containing protein [Psychrobacter sp. 16-Bac2893]